MGKKHLEEDTIIENGDVAITEEHKSKKSKKEKKEKKDKKDKKSKKEKKETEEQTTEAVAAEEVEIEDESELHIQAPKKIVSSDLGFISIESQIYLTLAPCYGDNLRQGINEQLNSLIMKFVPQLNGVVLSHSNSKPLQQNGKILFDCPFINFWVNASFLIWRPVIGSTLEGTVSLQSSDHLGLLVFNTFNVSIPASNIPKNKYKWKRNSEDAFTSGEWVSTDDDQPIANTNTITFKILEFSAAFDMLTITGSLDY